MKEVETLLDILIRLEPRLLRNLHALIILRWVREPKLEEVALERVIRDFV